MALHSANQPDFRPSTIFYDRAAQDYDIELTKHPTDILARTAFQSLVTRSVSPGSTLLDFGCGTGLDALEYARTGYRVIASDTSMGMLSRLRERCQSEIASGQVIPYLGISTPLVDQLARYPSPNAVTANFAVLNLIRDLQPTFAAFARHMASPGWLIVSVLNPLHWPLLLKRISGGGRRLLGDTDGALPTEACVTYLHDISELVRSARDFRLVGHGNAGTFVRYDDYSHRGKRRLWWGSANSSAKWCKRILWSTAASKLLGPFVFLVLRRDP